MQLMPSNDIFGRPVNQFFCHPGTLNFERERQREETCEFRSGPELRLRACTVMIDIDMTISYSSVQVYYSRPVSRSLLCIFIMIIISTGYRTLGCLDHGLPGLAQSRPITKLHGFLFQFVVRESEAVSCPDSEYPRSSSPPRVRTAVPS